MLGPSRPLWVGNNKILKMTSLFILLKGYMQVGWAEWFLSIVLIPMEKMIFNLGTIFKSMYDLTQTILTKPQNKVNENLIAKWFPT